MLTHACFDEYKEVQIFRKRALYDTVKASLRVPMRLFTELRGMGD